MQGGTVAVVGGSIGGCAAALALRRGGARDVTVFERADGRLRDRGVGVTLHEDRFAELEPAGYVPAGTECVALSRRIWTVADGATEEGRVLATHRFPFRAYTWGSLWAGLRRRVPDSVDYRSGEAVSAVEPDADGVTVRLAGGRRRRFDAVVGADGYRSVVRRALFCDLSPTYAGYLAWRGTSDVDPGPAVHGDAACTVVFPGGHCMLYRVPDPAGGHRLNWVLYTTPPDRLLPDLRQPTSLPPGRSTSALTAHLRELVAGHFPPYWAACVLRAPAESTFIQPIYDLEVPHYAVDRLLLVGDAATVARPHTGGGSVKALQDAAALEDAWRSGDSLAQTVSHYDAGRRAVGENMVALGRRLGRAQVERPPHWSDMDASDFDAWWQEQHRGSDRHSGFGGHALRT
jgi:2-polyprenyl-6-methoxyphenol hydroxylase-like FAD-dependent oxidoreductase